MELDTFEDGPYTEGPMDANETFEDEGTEGQVEEEESTQEPEGETVSTDSQVSLLDEEEETTTSEPEEEGEEKSDPENEEDKESDEESEDTEAPKDDAPEDPRESTEDLRTLKAFRDGKQYEIPEDATIKTKVAGKWEKPTLQELKDNYAGKVAYDRKFSELGDRTKHFDMKEQKFNAEMDMIKDHFTNLRSLAEKGMSGEADPNSAMNYLLDLMGINTVDYNKAMFTNMAQVMEDYSYMSEAEREAHWIRQENEYLVKRQESLTQRQADEQSRAETQKHINDLRETHSISEEDYVSAYNELLQEGLEQEKITPELIVKTAKILPLFDEADTYIEPYIDQLSDQEAHDLSVEIARSLYDGELTPEEVKTTLAEQFEVEQIMTQIESKVGKTQQKELKAKSQKSDHLESFDDFDSW